MGRTNVFKRRYTGRSGRGHRNRRIIRCRVFKTAIKGVSMKKQTRRAGYSKGYSTGRKFDRALVFYIVIGALIGALIVFIAAIASGL